MTCRCGGTGDDIPLAPPVMQLHFKAPLRCAFPFRNITYTRTGGFCFRHTPGLLVREDAEPACSVAD